MGEYLYQFPMGKVKTISVYLNGMSIEVSIPNGKGKEDLEKYIEEAIEGINSQWER